MVTTPVCVFFDDIIIPNHVSFFYGVLRILNDIVDVVVVVVEHDSKREIINKTEVEV